MLDRRCSLRYNRDVKQTLSAWSAAVLEAVGCGKVIGQAEYVSVFLLIYSALNPEVSEEEGVQAVLDDWNRDCKGRDVMDEETLKDALFELADTWTDDTSAESCAGPLASNPARIAYCLPPRSLHLLHAAPAPVPLFGGCSDVRGA